MKAWADRRGTLRGEPGDQRHNLPEPGVGVAATAPAELDGGPPEALDILQQAAAVGLLEHLAEDRAEQPDLGPERSR